VSTATTWPWAALLLLGAAHGVNPAMGWLFAVGLGLQDEDRRAVWRALPPLALGHALAIAAAILAAMAIGRVLPIDALKWLTAACLVGMGTYRLTRHSHPRLRGMRVGARDLTVWSFLMASAHGAGLMAVPFVFGAATATGADPHAAHAAPGNVGHAGHAAALHAGPGPDQLVGLLATAVHSLGYLFVTAVIAAIVYEKLGLKLLRTAWVNVDLIWAIALIATGVLTPLL